MKIVLKIVSVFLTITLLYGIAPAEGLGPFAIGTRFVYLSPVANFDGRLGNLGNNFEDDFKPDLFVQFYPTESLSIEYSLMISEHGLSFGFPTHIIGSTSLFTQTVSGKLHLSPDSTFSPYLGVGINILMPFNTSCFSDRFSIDNHTGWITQTGFDFRTTKNTWFNFEYRFMEMGTQAQINGTSYQYPRNSLAYCLL